MHIQITGKNLDIGDALRSHASERLEGLAQRFFDGAVSAHVTIEKQKTQFVTDCLLHLATGLVLQAHGTSGEAFASFDGAASHLEKQLRRYKSRLKNHHRARKEPVRKEAATDFVIAATADEEHGGEADLNPAVIAETPHSVSELSVGEAVMQLDISTVPFVLFRNVRDGGLNVVYRRADGNIGWINPSPRRAD
jgi:ribosomal subunit interface protein